MFFFLWEIKEGYEPTTHIHTQSGIVTAVPKQATVREQKYTSADECWLLWLHTNTHTHTGICTHIDAHCKDGTNTITHSRFSTQPRAESRWEKNKSGNKGGGGETGGEAEVRRRDGAKGSRWRRARNISTLSQGRFVSSASLLLRGIQILPSVTQTHSLILPLILPSARGKHPGHCLLSDACMCVCVFAGTVRRCPLKLGRYTALYMPLFTCWVNLSLVKLVEFESELIWGEQKIL